MCTDPVSPTLCHMCDGAHIQANTPKAGELASGRLTIRMPFPVRGRADSMDTEAGTKVTRERKPKVRDRRGAMHAIVSLYSLCSSG